jgi:hypothetical protein
MAEEGKNNQQSIGTPSAQRFSPDFNPSCRRRIIIVIIITRFALVQPSRARSRSVGGEKIEISMPAGHNWIGHG